MACQSRMLGALALFVGAGGCSPGPSPRDLEVARLLAALPPSTARSWSAARADSGRVAGTSGKECVPEAICGVMRFEASGAAPGTAVASPAQCVGGIKAAAVAAGSWVPEGGMRLPDAAALASGMGWRATFREEATLAELLTADSLGEPPIVGYSADATDRPAPSPAIFHHAAIIVGRLRVGGFDFVVASHGYDRWSPDSAFSASARGEVHEARGAGTWLLWSRPAPDVVVTWDGREAEWIGPDRREIRLWPVSTFLEAWRADGAGVLRWVPR